MKENTIFQRASERGCSWKEQAFYEGLPQAAIIAAEQALKEAEEQWGLASHNEGAGHEAVARAADDKFWGLLSGRIKP